MAIFCDIGYFRRVIRAELESQLMLCKKPFGARSRQMEAWGKRNKKNRYVVFAEAVSDLFHADDFCTMYPPKGQPSIHPAKLALVVILQSAEGLSDRAAADAVDTRIDWKYVLRMELDEPAFDHSVLTEFRQRLIKHKLEHVLLDRMLEIAAKLGILKVSKQRTDSTHVLASVRTLGRLERIHEAMRSALNALLNRFGSSHADLYNPVWIERYDRAPYGFRAPKDQKRRNELAMQMGLDIAGLLAALNRIQSEASPLANLAEVVALRKIFEQQYILKGQSYHLRDDEESIPVADRIASPHDMDARFGRKGSTSWLGYTAHFTESCVEETPRLITNVLTKPAGINDTKALPEIHDSLLKRGLKPEEHFLDEGYMDSEMMQTSEEKLGIKIIGPVRGRPSWQATADKGFDTTNFSIDFERKQATCPNGIVSTKWSQRADGKSIQIVFPRQECGKCPFKDDCTKSSQGRRLEIKNAELFKYMQAKRSEQKTSAFKEKYKIRSGIEGTHSQAVRTCNMRRSKYSSLEKTSFQACATAAGLNLIRMVNWLLEATLAKTRPNLRQKFARSA